MSHRFLFALRIPSLLLAGALQLLPIVRAALPAAQSAASVMAIIFRWSAGCAAALGGVQAVSGASTVITTPLNQRATNGVPLANSQIRLTTAPDSAHYWTASGLPSGLYVTNTSSTAFYIRGTPNVSGNFNVGLTAKDDSTSGSSRTTTATITINIASLVPPTPPVLGKPTIASGKLNLTTTGSPGQSWNVERASQIGGGWTSIGTLQIASDGTGQFIVTNLTSDTGLFRLKQP